MPFHFIADGELTEKNSRDKDGKTYRSVTVATGESADRLDVPMTPDGQTLWASLPDIGAQVRIQGRKRVRAFDGKQITAYQAEKLAGK
jgi:hypothetical protein